MNKLILMSLIVFGLLGCSTTEKAIQTALNPASILIPKSTSTSSSNKTPSGDITINCETGATCIINEGKRSTIIVSAKAPVKKKLPNAHDRT